MVIDNTAENIEYNSLQVSKGREIHDKYTHKEAPIPKAREVLMGMGHTVAAHAMESRGSGGMRVK
ncbi:hypothetical protein MB09_14950 [Aequorivita vladivostokensis]|uniref:Uncharacterized protein n=1 Tax=Aequorivita vladivostokensis TaxID=171194 RepID=A0ABR5DEV3_9FLAO|nr:hypothetical protein MB09_14950 [Aequorivita vladivostokensis]